MDKEIKDLIDSKPNKYLKWYLNICETRKHKYSEGYFELHHIYPKSIFGENDNIVSLSSREHYLVHLLIWFGLRQELGSKNKYVRKMSFAFTAMNRKNGKQLERYGNYNSKEYSFLKIAYSENNKGVKRSEETRRKLSESHKNQKPSEEMKKHLSIINSGENHPQFGTKHSDETKKKMSKPRSEQAKLNMKLAAQKRIEKLKEEGKPLAWNSGIKVSEEERQKMSERMIGDKNPNLVNHVHQKQ